MAKEEVKQAIESFFVQSNFTSEGVRKIRNLSIKNRVRLGVHRKRFCKHCLSQLRGKVSINRGYKTVICSMCGKKNRFKI